MKCRDFKKHQRLWALRHVYVPKCAWIQEFLFKHTQPVVHAP